ncbi:hypothetical protein F4560_004433 [Saccharothrix ecbatanensis]|uniref:Uncharacterized protein n=1 Tax=Saccharothrix ecbatanensis TaxID=1105145 RepID=A0A7W9HM42_9PSEU|nr:hypothetical protein [Saccharothrix ecbatanensis]MBB5804665.1 hypothetical protein [Saccharothrix ecbatanensis]
MGKRIIWTSDLPDAKGNYNEVGDPDELQKVFIGIGGDVHQLDLTEGEAQAFLKSVQKYVDASKKAHAEDDVKVFEDVFDTKQGYRKAAFSSGAARTAGTAGTATKPSMTGAEIAAKVDGLVWRKAAKFGKKDGDAVPESSKGLKDFVIAMGQDAGSTRIPNESYAAAIDAAIEQGIIGKAGDDEGSDDKSDD